jgi:nucleotide-binding universal stress UspA family protein
MWARPIRHFAQGVEQVMDYKTVMVGLALDRPNDACLRVAGDLAERFGARIIGVAASDIRPPMYFADGDFAQKLFDEEAAAIERRLSELEAEFRAAVERRATALEWRSARALPVPYLLQQARAADILVIGARQETLVDPSSAPDPSDLVMQAGRPLIVVPSTVEWLDLRSVLGRIRRIADSGCRQGSHDCRNSRAGRASRGSACPCCRRGGVAAWPRHHSEHGYPRKGRRRDRADREHRCQYRGWRRDCRRLRSLAAPPMGTQRRYPPPCN